jgi:hypothetical protein
MGPRKPNASGQSAADDAADGAAGAISVQVIWVEADGTVIRESLDLPAHASLRDLGLHLADSEQGRRLWPFWSKAAGFSIFGHLKDLDATLADGDRVEILASLQADPKEARRQRVNSVRQARAQAGAFDRWTRAR